MMIGLILASLPAQAAGTVKCLIGGRELDYRAISEMQLDAIGQFGMLRLWDAAGTDTGAQEAAKPNNPPPDLSKPDHVVILSPPNSCSEDGNIRSMPCPISPIFLKQNAFALLRSNHLDRRGLQKRVRVRSFLRPHGRDDGSDVDNRSI
jgi:hypothetical protein